MTEARPPLPVPPRRWHPFRILIGLVVALVLAAAVASRITLNYFVLSPGNAQSVAPLITVPVDKAHHVEGAVLLTDVYEGPVTALNYLFYQWSSNDQLVPIDELVPSGIPVSQLTAQGYLEMVQSKDAAKTAALRRLGYAVPEHDGGVVIEGVTTGAPASAALAVGQVITAVDGTSTTTLCAFVARLSAVDPGQEARLSVEQNRFSASGRLVRGAVVTKTVRLAHRPPGQALGASCRGFRRGGGFLGVAVATQQNFTFPFPITINTADIGGPSAGLAMTLGLINTLEGGNLTGGRRVAATGTIDPAGGVGDVGGVAQKTVAVEQAGASVFFVPDYPDALAAARSKAAPGLSIYGVSSLHQVLSILAKLGGHVPAAPADT